MQTEEHPQVNAEGSLADGGFDKCSRSPTGSAFLVNRQREKLVHLHAGRSMSQMVPDLDTYETKNPRNESWERHALGGAGGGPSSHYLTADDTLVPLLVMVVADTHNGLVTIYGSHYVTIQLISRRLAGDPNIWIENAPNGYTASSTTKSVLFLE